MTRTLRDRCVLLLMLLMPLVALILGVPAAEADDLGDTEEDSGAVSTDYGRMILVLDSSGSMAEPAGGGQSKIEAARAALQQVVTELPEESQVGLRVFGATVFSRSEPGACTDSQLVVEPGTDNRSELSAAVDDYQPFGETPIAHALRQAARDIGSEGRRSIVLVSDGEATCPPDPCRVAAELARRGIDLQIDVVGLDVSGRARSQLKCIAANGNGRYYDADTAGEIVESLTEAASRAARPFEVEGTPIEGGSSAETATPIEFGTFSDTIGPSGSATAERWFRVERTLDRSTVLAGAALLGRGGIGGGSLAIQLTNEEGEYCGGEGAPTPLSGAALLGIGAFAGGDQSGAASLDESCLTGDVLVRLSRPISGEVDERFTLRLSEEPAVVNAESLPQGLTLGESVFEEPAASGEPVAVTGGSSFGNATPLLDGTYTGTIVPGETQVFALEVGWGQRLAARLDTPEPSEALVEAGQLRDFANLQVFNRLGMRISDQPEGDDPNGFSASSDAAVMSIGTHPVRWKNRFANGSAYLDGTHYLVYSAARAYDGTSLEMPFTLTVEVQGEESGAPEYDDVGVVVEPEVPTPSAPSDGPADEPADPPSQELSSEDDEAAGDDQGAQEAGSTISTPVRLTAAGGLATVAAICVLVGVRLLRRRVV